jgi:hypothetical protein
MRNTEWKLQANCYGDEELFLEDTLLSASEGTPRHAEDAVGRAKKICFSCPVKTQCLTAAMEDESYLGGTERYGIRGGLTARERILIAAQDPMCARCRKKPVTQWQRVIHLKRLCRSCQQLVLADPAEKYFRN